MGRVLHVVPGLDDPTNGIAVAANAIAERQMKAGYEVEVIDTKGFISSSFDFDSRLRLADEVWVHSMWLPKTMLACWKVIRQKKRNHHSATTTSNYNPIASPRLVRMPHGCMDPVKVRYHLWKKIFFLPLEWWFLHKADRIISTEDDEDLWIANWHTGTTIGRVDLFGDVKYSPRLGLGNQKFLFIGRMHPLKGVDVLIESVRSLKDNGQLPVDFQLTIIGKDEKGLRAGFESAAQGLPITFLGELEEEVKRREMAASDCLLLPTLSENFGLVVKESLECGVPVITTDGAKYWKGMPGVIYLEGYLAASHLRRVQMLGEALKDLMEVRS